MSDKKAIRSNFRNSVFKRDKYACRCCGKKGQDRQCEDKKMDLVDLDAHHITNRDIMPKGGYVAQNGISVCDECHLKAEVFWQTGVAEKGFSPEELYALIGSSYEEAFKLSEKL